MRFKPIWLGLLALLAAWPLYAVYTPLEVIFELPRNAYEADIKDEILISSVPQTVTSFANETFVFDTPLTIKFGGYEDTGFEPDLNQIQVPYYFIDDIKERFRKVHYEESGVSIHDASMDALMHTLFHELAHALIDMYSLPVLGREEDAADGLATVLLLHYFDEGAEIAISAADLFALESEERDEFDDEDFWGEHSLDEQRFYTTVCFIYGSDPEGYAYLRDLTKMSDRRADVCYADYERLAKSWMAVLDTHLIK